MSRYIVATKREARGDGISAAQRLQGLSDIEIQSEGNSDRVIIESSPQTVEEIQRRFGEKLLVEPEILHFQN